MLQKTDKRLLVSTILTSSLLASGAVADSIGEPGVSRLRACGAIADAAPRLACFDALARMVGSIPADEFVARPPARGPRSRLGLTPPRPGTEATPDRADPNADRFGFDSSADAEEIASRIDGEFAGWSGKTLFRLENGQVWKQAQPGDFDARATRPAVRIRRAAFGTFRLAVQGEKKSVRVVRIK